MFQTKKPKEEVLEGTDKRLDRYLAWSGRLWLPPKVEVTEGWIRYQNAPTRAIEPLNVKEFKAAGWRSEPAELNSRRLDELVWQFARLSQIKKTSGASLARFVKKWGPLWFCSEHQVCSTCYSRPFVVPTSKKCPWPAKEPVEEWIKRSRQVNAALTIGARLIAKDKIPTETWSALHGPDPDVRAYDLETDEDEDSETDQEALIVDCEYLFKPKSDLTWFIREQLLESVTVGFDFVWPEGVEPSVKFAPGLGFYSLMWLLVAQTLARTSLVICSSCQRPYERVTKGKQRRPKEGQANYCPACRKKRPSKKHYDRVGATHWKKGDEQS